MQLQNLKHFSTLSFEKLPFHCFSDCSSINRPLNQEVKLLKIIFQINKKGKNDKISLKHLSFLFEWHKFIIIRKSYFIILLFYYLEKMENIDHCSMLFFKKLVCFSNNTNYIVFGVFVVAVNFWYAIWSKNRRQIDRWSGKRR
jgi:hypothetical protein